MAGREIEEILSAILGSARKPLMEKQSPSRFYPSYFGIGQR